MASHRQGGSKARRSRVFGAGTAVSAFLTFGMAPLAATPTAHADIEDVWVDLFGPDLGTAVADLSADWGDQAAWAVVFDPGVGRRSSTAWVSRPCGMQSWLI